jgi:hypothetical protein
VSSYSFSRGSTSLAETSPSKDDILIDLSDNNDQTTPVQVQYTQIPLQMQYTAYPIQQQYTSFSQQLQPQYTAAYSGFQNDMPQHAYAAQQEAMQVSLLASFFYRGCASRPPIRP